MIDDFILSKLQFSLKKNIIFDHFRYKHILLYFKLFGRDKFFGAPLSHF